MGNLKTNVLCILIFVVACNITFSVGIGWTKFNYESYFSGYKCVPNETLFQTEDVFHPTTCGKLCDMNNQCLSVMYQPENHQCIGCRANLYGAHYDALPGSMYFSSKKPCAKTEYQRMCYYDSKSSGRSGEGKCNPDNIDAKLCTHIIYSNAQVGEGEIDTTEWTHTNMFKKLQKLKVESPCLKTLITVGDFDIYETGFTDMVENRETRQKFIDSVPPFLRKYGFDGLHVKWEYPGSSDKQNFVHLVQEMKSAFVTDGYLLTAALPAKKNVIDDGYDVIQLVEHLDFINLMTYDNYGGTGRITRGTSPLSTSGQNIGQNQVDMKWGAEYLISKGVPKTKLVIGMGVFGRTFILDNEGDNMIGTPAKYSGSAGQFTQQRGKLSYYEICLMQESINVTVHWSAEQTFPYFVNGKLWIGYENVRSISEKVTWLKEEGYGGAMIWSLDLDDFREMCKSSKRPYPLVSVMYDILTSG